MAATLAAAAEFRAADTRSGLGVEWRSPQEATGELEQTSHTAQQALTNSSSTVSTSPLQALLPSCTPCRINPL